MTGLDCIVMGAAGRDFHDFLTFFRDHPEMRVRCFTAEQIPFIENRVFPKELAPDGYDEDIPIHLEKELPELIQRYGVSLVFMSYSDLAHADVMHKASRVQAAGASFVLLGPGQTQLRSKLPVLSVTAVRTGAGKSPLSQKISAHLGEQGKRVAVLRHPMPYGDLAKQAVQRFATPEDLDRHECTVEEREEYAPYVNRGMTIWAGVDYRRILAAAEEESDIVLWDGGNNDTPFVKPDLSLVVVDALRAGHEVSYYPGETGFRSADVLVINKVRSAKPEDLEAIRKRAAELNPDAVVVESDLKITVEDPDRVRGKRVLVVEDGPTVTHGEMPYGAGTIAAKEQGAAEIVDPRPHAVGTIAESYRKYPHVEHVLPALGYSEEQRGELAETIRGAAPDVVLDASPASVGRLLGLDIPVVRVTYAFEQISGPELLPLVTERLGKASGR